MSRARSIAELPLSVGFDGPVEAGYGVVEPALLGAVLGVGQQVDHQCPRGRRTFHQLAQVFRMTTGGVEKFVRLGLSKDGNQVVLILGQVPELIGRGLVVETIPGLIGVDQLLDRGEFTLG